MTFFAASNSWIPLLGFIGFVLVSALANYLKRKQAEREAGNLPPDDAFQPRPNQPAPRAPQTKTSWEEEIRKLLEGETGEPTPPVVPPVMAERPRPVPPVAAPAALPPHLARNQVRRAAEPPEDSEAIGMPVPQMTVDIHTRLARLNESAAAYTRSSQLTERVTARMHAVEKATAEARPEAPRDRRNTSTDIAEAVRLLRAPHSARQAMIASVVFGPPKSFEG